MRTRPVAQASRSGLHGCCSSCRVLDRWRVHYRHIAPGGAGPSTVIEAALHQMMNSSGRFKITIEQITPQSRVVSTGVGAVNFRRSTGEVVINVAGGGNTLVQQIGAKLRLKSYNTPAQLKAGQWVYLNESSIPEVLSWPPVGVGDPTFLFVSAGWPRVLADNLVSTKALGKRQISGISLSGYQLELRSFKRGDSSSTGPRLDCWIGDNELRTLMLYWPAKEAASPAPGYQNLIVITLDLFDFTH